MQPHRVTALVRAALLVPLALAPACGESVEDRPLELDYLTQAIFAPSCGQAQCHTAFKQGGKYTFDHPEGVRRSLLDRGLIIFDSDKYDADDPSKADLIRWLTEIDPLDAGIGRMPYDAPLPNKDILLLQEWIGAEAPGAQCNPDNLGGMACRNREVVQCNPDWTFGARVMLCSSGCVQGVCQ